MLRKIISHMIDTDEWGEFFPSQISAVPYNHSMASRYFPLTREQAIAKGLPWLDEDTVNPKSLNAEASLPDRLPSSNEAILTQCIDSHRPFKITSREIALYRKLQVPLPRNTYDERFEKRIRKLGSLELQESVCAKTGKKIYTTFDPNRWLLWDQVEYSREFNS